MKIAFFILALLTALASGFWLGMTFQNNRLSSFERLERQQTSPDFFNYTLSDGSHFSRGIVDQISNNTVYLRTNDEVIPLLIDEQIKIVTAIYPLSNTQKLTGDANFNNIHHYDKIDVRWTKTGGRNFAVNIVVWTNLRKQP